MDRRTRRSYYEKNISDFLKDDPTRILGEIATCHEFAIEELQRYAWIEQIRILQHQLLDITTGHILFEYAIPRMGKRVDVILLLKGLIFVLEFKVGEDSFTLAAKDQALDYSLDLKNFHEASHLRKIFPVVVATHAPPHSLAICPGPDGVFSPLFANRENLIDILNAVCLDFSDDNISLSEWSNSRYKPTPTIVEAAQALYQGHSVKDISRADSGAINLSRTSSTIAQIIESSKTTNSKSICFVTGVPGSGKTLAGLTLANERHDIDKGEHAVFLSGNGPLVLVLQEALARNEVKAERKGTDTEKITKKIALSRTKVFIQNIHHFRDEALKTKKAPVERVAVFDEAQRAWSLEQTKNFMKKKKGIPDFEYSEPEFLLSVMDRHNTWAVVVCIVGGGQEINTGEAGLPEWFNALKNYYRHWNVYVAPQLSDHEYTRGGDLYASIPQEKLHRKEELHLSVSVRSYRSEKVSQMVKAILDGDSLEAKSLYNALCSNYPIALTRDINRARAWLRNKARGTERIGMLSSSGAYRLRPHGINVRTSIDPKHWFLNDKEDVRSSFALEETATEFDVQGLELDWACVAWDADFRYQSKQWKFHRFQGTRWQHVKNDSKQLYLKNAYRVLLTRARQGMVIFIPLGDSSDQTRKSDFYDGTFSYLKNLGIPEL